MPTKAVHEIRPRSGRLGNGPDARDSLPGQPNRYQSPIGYRRSMPPHVRANARTLLSIRFRYAYGGDQAKSFIILLQLVTVE